LICKSDHKRDEENVQKNGQNKKKKTYVSADADAGFSLTFSLLSTSEIEHHKG
jgi:hypothetical protein